MAWRRTQERPERVVGAILQYSAQPVSCILEPPQVALPGALWQVVPQSLPPPMVTTTTTTISIIAADTY